MTKVAEPVSIPRIYFGAAEDEASVVAVEHADLPNPRITEAFIARCVFEMGEQDREVVIVSASLSRDRYCLESMLDDAVGSKRKSFSSGGCTAYVVVSSKIWLVDAKTVRLRDLPFGSVNTVLMLDAHAQSEELALVFQRITEKFIAVGSAASQPGDWFSELDGARHKFTAEQIVERWPDQAQFVIDDRDPDYSRLMLCERPSAEAGRVPFTVFAGRRLSVRTDKTDVFLSERQRKQAAEQYGTPVVSLELSKLQRRYLAQKRLARLHGRKPWFLLLKYRRGGFTTLEQALNYHVSVEHPRSYVAALADTHDKMRRIFRIAKLYQEHDPRSPRLVGDSKTQLEFANGSFYFIGTAGSSGFARGDTLQRVHGSEVAKWCNGNQEQVEEVMAGILGATEHGEVVLETTANGIEWFATQWRLARAGQSDFNCIFLRWFDDPTNRIALTDEGHAMIKDTLTDEEKELAEKHGIVAEQIAFRRDRKRTFGRLFPQEYPEDEETCFIVSGSPYFDTDVLLALMRTLPDLKDGRPEGAKHLSGGWEMEWERPRPGVRYVLGADTSEGLPGCDPNGLGVMRSDTGEQVFSLHGLFKPAVLAEHIVRVSKKYNGALIGVERENHGHAVLQKIIELGVHAPHYKGGRLYYHSKGNSGSKAARAGWSTNAVTRPIMLNALSDWISDGGGVRDRQFLGECLTFRLQSDGKFKADSGCHDDSVMKWAICEQMRQIPVRKLQFIGD